MASEQAVTDVWPSALRQVSKSSAAAGFVVLHIATIVSAARIDNLGVQISGRTEAVRPASAEACTMAALFWQLAR